MASTSAAKIPQVVNCEYCGGEHGKLCPQVKAFEYHEDGKTLKRVIFR